MDIPIWVVTDPDGVFYRAFKSPESAQHYIDTDTQLHACTVSKEWQASQGTLPPALRRLPIG